MSTQFNRGELEVLAFNGETHTERALARMLLAGMDSEPVAVIDKEGSPMTRAECNDDMVFAICCKVGTPLYAAPPAPAIPEGWEPCRPEWIERNGPCSCAEAPRIAFGTTGTHYHPHIWHKPAPVAVPDEIEPTSGSSDFEDYYCDGWNACRAAMLNAGPVTAATVPEGRVAKAILHACECFLLGCSVDTKNYENYFYDEETGISFTIYELAEKLGIVNCIGNRCWSLHSKVRDEIDQVYRKYALLMLAAAPAAPEQE